MATVPTSATVSLAKSSSSPEADQLISLIASSAQTILSAYNSAGLPVPDLNAARKTDEALLTADTRDATRVLEGACAQLCSLLAHPSHLMMNRSNSGLDAALIRVALECKIADHLLEGPKSVEELAKLSGVDKEKLSKVLRSLANKHVFRAVSKDVYVNNRLSVALLQDDLVSSFIGHSVDEAAKALTHLPDTMIDPEYAFSKTADKTCFTMVHGKPLFSMFSEDLEKGKRFNRGMQSWTAIHGGADTLALYYPWSSVPAGTRICDVGGNKGHVSMALLRTHPHLKVVVQDLPAVIDDAKKVWETDMADVLHDGRAALVPLDFFAGIPVQGCDFYYVKHILHDWPDAECVKILTNIRKAISDGHGKLLIQEFVLAAAGANAGLAKAPAPLLSDYGYGTERKYNLDIVMMAMLNSKERTLDEYSELGNQSGFKLTNTYFDGETTIMELEPVA